MDFLGVPLPPFQEGGLTVYLVCLTSAEKELEIREEKILLGEMS